MIEKIHLIYYSIIILRFLVTKKDPKVRTRCTTKSAAYALSSTLILSYQPTNDLTTPPPADENHPLDVDTIRGSGHITQRTEHGVSHLVQ